ncbi:MAG: DUF2384 domain-containing protein [bacterium]|nr:DUF2384 domain-containing protein [bacterium]
MDEAITEILGVKRRVASLLDVADIIEQGLSPRAIDSVKVALKLSDHEISAALGVSMKTVSHLRAQPKKKLTVVVGDRLFRATHLFALAKSVLGNADSAREWLRTSQIGLNNRVPLELMNTEAGTREIEDLLGRIEYGVLS